MDISRSSPRPSPLLMSSGKDLGTKRCVWGGCDKWATELVEMSSGILAACCYEHAKIERAIAKRRLDNRYEDGEI